MLCSHCQKPISEIKEVDGQLFCPKHYPSFRFNLLLKIILAMCGIILFAFLIYSVVVLSWQYDTMERDYYYVLDTACHTVEDFNDIPYLKTLCETIIL